MIKLDENSDILSLLEQGYYIVCSRDEKFDDETHDDMCDEYWHIEWKSIYIYTLIHDYEECYWDKWHKNYEEWRKEDFDSYLNSANAQPWYACSIDELQKFI